MGPSHQGGVVDKEDLRDLRDTLTALINEGFKGVHARQDVTNGRIQKAEVEAGRQDIRLKNLERDVFHRRQTDRRPTAAEDKPDEESRALTRRELRIVLATLSAAAGIVTFVWKVLPAIVKAFTP